MIISIDIGIKNFGIFITDNDFKPLFLKNLNLHPYSATKLKESLDKILLKFNFSVEFPNTILIEQQLACNKKACFVAAQTEMYFLIKFPNIEIIFCNSKNKNLGKVESYSKRKKESVEKANAYFIETGEMDYFEILAKEKKKDDMADAVCQLVTFFKIQ